MARQERHAKTLIIIPNGMWWVPLSAPEGAQAHQRDTHGLLNYDGLAHSLGSKPPITHAPGHDWKEPTEGLDAFASVGCRRCGKREWMGTDTGCPGLAIIVDGQVVPEACDHLARRIYQATDEFYREMWGENYDPGRLGVAEARALAEWACSEDLLWDYEGDEDKPIGGLGTLLEW